MTNMKWAVGGLGGAGHELHFGDVVALDRPPNDGRWLYICRDKGRRQHLFLSLSGDMHFITHFGDQMLETSFVVVQFGPDL